MNVDLLKKLVETPGVSGREDRVRKLVLEELKPMVDSINTDVLGNVIGVKKGRDAKAKIRKKIMVAAHIDEIGFYVTFIDEKGFLRFHPAGGFDLRALKAQRVVVHGRKDVIGVIGSKPIHILTEEEKKKPPELKDYFIDLGMKKEQVDEIVKLGDPVTMERSMAEMGDCLTAKAFDDRIGVFVMVEALRKVKFSPADLYIVGTTQEEVGLRGAFAAASGVNPEVGIALDGTLANDFPGVEPQDEVSTLGGGAAISFMNGAAISNPKLFDRFVELAEKHKIKYQKDLLPRGGTDAGALQRVSGGAAVITLSVPTRYMHTTVETLHKDDVQAAIDLLTTYLEDPGDMDYRL